MEKTRVLYITPHLSTGGLPQYLLTKIKENEDGIDSYVIEWDDITGGRFIVQRKQIVNLAKDFWTLIDKSIEGLEQIIKKVDPDIIHFEEIPETFIKDKTILEFLFREDREYLIVESTHGSFTNSNIINYVPDHFIFPSEYCYRNFSNLGVPMTVWDIPITQKKRELTKIQAKEKLGITTCSSCKHILIVGLFTPGKNQSEAFELARHYEHHNIYFHFVGNQADNFRDYWEPLMANKPENCYVWGEREDVDVFYQACDFFLFPSKFELNPLVVKEALSWDLPVMMYRLDTYMGKYDPYDNIYYMSPDFNENCEIISKIIKDTIYKRPETIKPVDKSKQIVAIPTHADTDEKKELLIECINEMKKQGYAVIVSSHIPLDDIIYELSDYVIYDKDNPVIYREDFQKYSSYSFYTINHPGIEAQFILSFNHGYAAIRLFKAMSAVAEANGYDIIHLVNYDYILHDEKVLIGHAIDLDKNDLVSYKWGSDPESVNTGLFSTKPSILNRILRPINSKKDYCGINKHTCEATVYELYKKQGLKMKITQIENLEKSNIVNKIAVKVFPLHFDDGNQFSTFLADSSSGTYLISFCAIFKTPYTLRLESAGFNYSEYKVTGGVSVYKLPESVLKDTLTVYINDKISETITPKSDRGTCTVKHESIIKDLRNV